MDNSSSYGPNKPVPTSLSGNDRCRENPKLDWFPLDPERRSQATRSSSFFGFGTLLMRRDENVQSMLMDISRHPELTESHSFGFLAYMLTILTSVEILRPPHQPCWSLGIRSYPHRPRPKVDFCRTLRILSISEYIRKNQCKALTLAVTPLSQSTL